MRLSHVLRIPFLGAGSNVSSIATPASRRPAPILDFVLANETGRSEETFRPIVQVRHSALPTFMVAMFGLATLSPLACTRGPQMGHTPEHYGTFAEEGKHLEELKEFGVVTIGPTIAIVGSPMNPSTPAPRLSMRRPSLIHFSRSLRATQPTFEIVALRHLIQSIFVASSPNEARCDPTDSWVLTRPSASVKIAPEGQNPEMIRLVVTEDLAPGWYAVVSDNGGLLNTALVFGVQAERSSVPELKVESFAAGWAGFAARASGRAEYQPAGTYLRQNPSARRSPIWKCAATLP